MHRFPTRRFRVERKGEIYLVVDWSYGLYKTFGDGSREAQERVLCFLRAHYRQHGDANILALPRRVGTPPRWRIAPPGPRPGWEREQREIAKAFASIGETARALGLDGDASLRHPAVRFKARQAANLLAHAMSRL